jgi:hypothetical protein
MDDSKQLESNHLTLRVTIYNQLTLDQYNYGRMGAG